MAKVQISTVTPVYRGERTLPDLVAHLAAVREAWRQGDAPFELVEAIFVDDGSVDDSERVLGDLAEAHDFVRVTTLTRNFGQHPATVAGILHSAGDWIVTLDEDLQHRPDDMEPLLRRGILGRQDVVYASPTTRVHRGWFRDAASRTYKRLLSYVAGDPNVRHFNSFRALRGSIARAAAAVSSHDLYFDVVLGWFTQRVTTLPLDLHDPRADDDSHSGYSLHRLLSHARRALISSQSKWLRLAAALGVGSMLFSVALAAWIVLQKILAPETIQVRGWTSLFVAVVFFGGLCAFLFGVVLEYLSTVMLQVQGKPAYFVVDRAEDESKLLAASDGAEPTKPVTTPANASDAPAAQT